MYEVAIHILNKNENPALIKRKKKLFWWIILKQTYKHKPLITYIF